MSHWYVYIIEATDSRLYTGITTDIERRWAEHSGTSPNKTKGAKFFRGRKPKRLCYVVQQKDRSQASQLEAKIKKLSRIQKMQLIDSEENQCANHSLYANQN